MIDAKYLRPEIYEGVISGAIPPGEAANTISALQDEIESLRKQETLEDAIRGALCHSSWCSCSTEKILAAISAHLGKIVLAKL